MRSLKAALITLSLAAALPCAAQAPAGAPVGPQVGDQAPDFALPASARGAKLGAPVKLSALKGQVVVIAFYPRTRTSGCTAQMNAYRDKWDDLFKGGKGVTVLATSTDADTMQANWATEAKYPVTFVSDTAKSLAVPYAVARSATSSAYQRVLYVIGKDGKIAHVMRPFRELVEDSYTELAKAVDDALKAR